MGQNTIATASLKLTADASGLTKGLDSADQQMKAWGKRQEKQKNDIAQKGKAKDDQSGKSDDQKGKPTTWMGRLAAVATTGASAFAAITAAATAAMLAFSRLSDPILATAKAARELGVGAEGLSALSYAAKVAGVGIEDLQAGIAQLEGNLSSAEGDRYIRELGLDAQKLRQLPVDEAMAQVADALKGITDPARRARLALAIFGEKAVQLKPLLDKGGAGIRALTDEAKKTGNAFNDLDAENVRKANEALARMSAGFQGLMNRVVIGAAPWVEWATQVVGAVSGTAWSAVQGFGAGLTDYLVVPVMKAAAPVVDVFVNISSAISAALSPIVAWVDAYVVQPLASAAGAIPGILSNVAGAVPGILSGVGQAFGDLPAAFMGGWSGITGWAETYVVGPARSAMTALQQALAPTGGTVDTYLVGPFMDWASAVADNAVPMVTSALESIQPYTDTVGGWFSSAFASISDAASQLADVFMTGLTNAIESFGIDSKAVFAQVQSVVETLIGYVKTAASYVTGLFDYITRRTSAGDAVRGAADSLVSGGKATGEKAGEAIGRGISDGVKRSAADPLNSVKGKILASMTQLENELRKGIATIGMTGPEAKIWELGQQKDIDTKQLDKLKELAQQAKQVEAAWGVIEVPPLEMWQRQIAGLDKMLEDGRISMEQYQRGIAKAGAGLVQAANLGPLKTVGGMQKDSSAAVSAIIKSNLQDRVTTDPAAEMRRAQKELLEVQKRQLAVSEKLLEETKKGNDEDGWEAF